MECSEQVTPLARATNCHTCYWNLSESDRPNLGNVGLSGSVQCLNEITTDQDWQFDVVQTLGTSDSSTSPVLPEMAVPRVCDSS